MQKFASFILLLLFFGLGTGSLARLHDLQHEAEDAREDAAAKATGVPAQNHHHDETNCHVHAQLHLPALAVGWVPLLIVLGLLIAFLTQLAEPQRSTPSPTRPICRGPPCPLFA